MHSNRDLGGSLMSLDLKMVADQLRAGTATTQSVSAANLSLAEKDILLKVLAGTATVAAVQGAAVDMALKSAILASPQLVLLGNHGTSRVGTVAAA